MTTVLENPQFSESPQTASSAVSLGEGENCVVASVKGLLITQAMYNVIVISLCMTICTCLCLQSPVVFDTLT